MHWPKWKPDKILRAVDLEGLEDYLLTLPQLTSHENIGHGVIKFNLFEDISIEITSTQDKSSFLVSVKNISGVTSNRKPVKLIKPLKKDISFSSGQPHRFDAWIAIDNNIESKISDDRRQLILEYFNDILDDRTNHLFIGSFEVIKEKCKLLRRPWVYSFSSFEPHDENDEWLKPFSNAISDMIESIKINKPTHNPVDLLVYQQSIELAYYWRLATVEEVNKKVNFINRLIKAKDDLSSLIKHSYLENDHLVAAETSDDLPRQLADKLNEHFNPNRKLKKLKFKKDFSLHWENERKVKIKSLDTKFRNSLKVHISTKWCVEAKMTYTSPSEDLKNVSLQPSTIENCKMLEITIENPVGEITIWPISEPQEINEETLHILEAI